MSFMLEQTLAASYSISAPTHTELFVPGLHLTNKEANLAFTSTSVNEEKTTEPILLNVSVN